jgi:HD-GYP domain-containing protein (c-di-GMP phosphodiesterase class II)
MIPTRVLETIPDLLRIQQFLMKIDQLQLPAGSRCDVERILVKQAAREIDRALPSHVGHGQRTALLADAIGRALQLQEESLHHLLLASYLHDIGLLGLPPRYLDSGMPLDAESYRLVQNHARLGASLLEPFSFLRAASVIVAHHHERWDGTGYPYGIRGPFIPLEARILSVADAFDAIEVPGADSVALRDHVAYRIIRVGSEVQFDPAIVVVLGDMMKTGGIQRIREKCIE